MDVCSQILTSWRDWRVWSGGEDVLRELMAILDTTAQKLCPLRVLSSGDGAVSRPTRQASEVNVLTPLLPISRRL